MRQQLLRSLRGLAFDGARGWKLFPVYGYGYRLDRVPQVPA
ncbi:hypothetical protein [Caenimonas koreensis]|nr:hypothetical protein [Caenimonas koreensis]